MLRKKTYGFFISLLLISVSVFGADEKKDVTKIDTLGPMFRSLSLEADLAGPLGYVLQSPYQSAEAGIRANIWGKYFPNIEVGYAKALDVTLTGMTFNTSAPYLRLGLDFNLLKNQKKKGNTELFLIGAKLGASTFQYNSGNILFSNDYWNENMILDKSIQSFKIWYEITASMRVMLSKNMFAGWTIRNKKLIGSDPAGSYKPLYIPGYGQNNTSNWGFTYHVGYVF